MKKWFFIAVAVGLVGCGPVPPDDDDNPPPPPKAEPCEAAPTDDFAMGVVIFENPRWFRAFDKGCDEIELQSGLQGGWHIEPALQAPSDASIDDLGGQMRWEVRDESDEVVATAQFEMFRNFWQELEGGNAYWGDFVIFNTSTYPDDLVGTNLTVEVELDFDDESTLEDTTLEETLPLVDDK